MYTEMQVTGEEKRLPPEAELNAFRIAREAVNNVIRHAGARKLVLTPAPSQGYRYDEDCRAGH